MKIQELADGTFRVRKGFGYVDLVKPNQSWTPSYASYRWCVGTREECEAVVNAQKVVRTVSRKRPRIVRLVRICLREANRLRWM